MDLELVKQLEPSNDGQTIHLFYDDMVGMYVSVRTLDLGEFG
jgi:hypothetical protein